MIKAVRYSTANNGISGLKAVVWIGCASFVIAMTIGLGSVNSTSLTIVPIIRAICLICSAVCLLLILRSRRLPKEALVGVLIFAVFGVYGIARGTAQFGSLYTVNAIGMSLILCMLGIVFFSVAQDIKAQIMVSVCFVLFSLAWIVFLIFSGGFSMSFPPKFNYDISTSYGVEVTYSQGTSRFFGLAALLSFSLIRTNPLRHFRAILLICAISFSVLSLLGGGRGDFLFLIVTIILVFATGGLKSKVFVIVLSALAYYAMNWALSKYADDILAILRFKVLIEGEGLGVRGVLYEQGINLLLSEPTCLLSGCGYGYFQAYHGYPLGLYPHNIVIEGMITWGLPAFTLLMAAAAFGAVKMGTKGPLFWCGLYFLLVALKSGDVLNSWLAMSFLFYLAGIGIAYRAHSNTASSTGDFGRGDAAVRR